MTFEIIAIICAVQQPRHACTSETARDVYILGEETSELACMRRAQMADGAVNIPIGDDEYKKYGCRRKP